MSDPYTPLPLDKQPYAQPQPTEPAPQPYPYSATPPPAYNGHPYPGDHGQPYPYPQGGYPAWQQPQQEYNVLAIITLAVVFLFSPAAVVTGILSLRQIKRSGQKGEWMAWVGIAWGGVSALFALAWVLFMVMLAAAGGSGAV